MLGLRCRQLLALLAALACLIGAGLAVWFQERTNQNTAARLDVVANKLDVSRAAAIAACERNDVQTVQSNRKGLALYSLMSLTLRISRATMKQQGVPPGEAQYVKPYLDHLTALMDAQAWIPPTDCTRQVQAHGLHYKLPNAVPFTKRMPPRSALVWPPQIKGRS